jgi:hypothetical protein
MAPVILWIVIMMYHNWFMDGWPGKRNLVRGDA